MDIILKHEFVICERFACCWMRQYFEWTNTCEWDRRKVSHGLTISGPHQQQTRMQSRATFKMQRTKRRKATATQPKLSHFTKRKRRPQTNPQTLTRPVKTLLQKVLQMFKVFCKPIVCIHPKSHPAHKLMATSAFYMEWSFVKTIISRMNPNVQKDYDSQHVLKCDVGTRYTL